MTMSMRGRYRPVGGANCGCCGPALRALSVRLNAECSRRGFVLGAAAAAAAGLGIGQPARAQGAPQRVLFEGVRVFDGVAGRLSAPTNVLVVGARIESVAAAAAAAAAGDATRIAGRGRMLMPGLIDAHVHLMFATVPQAAMLTADFGFVVVAAAKAAQDMLLRGFTSVRDMGGPVFGVKQAIDAGLVSGPRIWPSGAFVSQTGGHGDFRLPNELPARPGDHGYAERVGAAAIADDPDAVRQRVREQLALGASQIKMMAGGGISSAYDPLDVTQYTVPELRAGVEAAANWGTYVAVHAYTPHAVRQALDAGVKCIDHGQLLDEPTVEAMARQGVWWSLQPFFDEGAAPRYAEGSPNRRKQQQMRAGIDAAYRLARRHGVKTAWGTDTLFDPALAARQGEQLASMARWYPPAEILRMATSTNAELLALSGLRSPYDGALGVVAPGALADLLLIDGDPLADIRLVADPARLVVVMKDGVIHKNTAA